MFIDINGNTYSKYSIQSYYSKDVIENNITSYDIIYHLVSGVVLVESFNSDSDRGVKLSTLEGV